MRCDEVRDAAPEFVLGTLDGLDRARMLEHVNGCVLCREEIAALSITLSDMALLAPLMRPSEGFTDLVVARAAAVDRDEPVVALVGASRRDAGRRWPLLIAMAAVVAALAVGLVVRRTEATTGAVAFTPMVTPDGSLMGAVSDSNGMVTVAVSYPTNWPDYRLEVIRRDGSTMTLGSMTWWDGAWRWQGNVIDPDTVDRLRVVRPDGRVTCWGRLPA